MARKEGFDEFGNPIGKAFDLGGVDDDRLKGEKILLYVSADPQLKQFGEYEWNLVQKSVAERNLIMDIVRPPVNTCILDKQLLSSYSQLWYVSHMVATITESQTQMICNYVKNGNGLLLWADNDPYYQDANIIAKNLIGTVFSGDKNAGGILKPGNSVQPGYFVEHSLTQGVNQLFEGHTICTIAPAEHLTILAQSHDGQRCMACYEYNGQRIVLDTGFTKVSPGSFHKTAGTARYFRNIAFWLSRGARNVEYKSFTPGRESLATINPSGTSEKYKYNVTQPVNLTYILHWEGIGTLGLVIQDPQGHTVCDASSAKAPIRMDVTANVPGDYLCWVTGVNVPKSNFPYVLTLVLHKGAVTVAPVTVSNSAAVSSVTKRLPVYVVMDGSSRASDYALNLDLGVRTLADRLRGRVSKGASASLSLLLANEDGQQPVPLTEIERFTLPKLVRRGKCGLGRALAKVSADISSKLMDGKPLVIIVLTGAPEDDWTSQADQLRNFAVQGKANVFVIGVGGYNDVVALKRLTPSTPLSLPVLTQVYAQQTFDWLYQIVDMILGGMESGASGQSRNVSPPPDCIKMLA
jgi:uncharacterized protein YegL